MKFEKSNGLVADIPEVELSADLDWMLQSQQVSDQALSEALVTAHFFSLFRFTKAVLLGEQSAQEAFNRVIDGLSWAVHHRQAYWGGSSVKVWLYATILRRLRKTKPGRRWSKSALRLLLCDLVEVTPTDADTILANKRSSLAKEPAEDLAMRRLAFARRNVSDDEQSMIQAAIEADQAENGEGGSFAIPDEVEIVRLILETATQAGVGRILSRNLLQAIMLGTLVIALVGFVLYRTTIEQEISARVTPPTVVKLVTWTPEPDNTSIAPGTGGLSIGNPETGELSWITLPESLGIDNLIGATAEQYFRPQYSGLLALAAVSNYWGQPISMDLLVPSLQPDPKDSVVMFYELQDFARSMGFSIDFRLGGRADMLSSFVDAGFPIIAQIGYDGNDTWDGQFVVVNGYDESRRMLMVSLLGLPSVTEPVRSTSDLMVGEISYDEFDSRWGHFAGGFLVIYRPENPKAQMGKYEMALYSTGMNLEEGSYGLALQRAQADMSFLRGRSLFFAIFNYATSLVYMRDYGTAASIYNQAFEQYESLNPASQPYRVMWYQTRPYWAYYYSGDYGSLVTLADKVLAKSGEESTLEETYYWRALGKEGLGNITGAIEDLEKAIALNPSFLLAVDQLARIRAR